MWPDATNTQELLDQAKAGNADAVDRLLGAASRTDSPHDRFAARTGPSCRRVDASDVVQDVLIEVSRRLQDYLQKPTMPFHLWLRQYRQGPHHRRGIGATIRAQKRGVDPRASRCIARPGLIIPRWSLAGQLLDTRLDARGPDAIQNEDARAAS